MSQSLCNIDSLLQYYIVNNKFITYYIVNIVHKNSEAKKFGSPGTAELDR